MDVPEGQMKIAQRFNLKDAPMAFWVSPKGLLRKETMPLYARANNQPKWSVIGADEKIRNDPLKTAILDRFVK